MRPTACRSCATPLTSKLIDLGSQPLANAYLDPGAEASERRFPLIVRICPTCLLVQADHSIPANAIFTSNYAYFSSYSASWVAHAKHYAEAMIARFGLAPESRVVEVASNDGYLLQHFRAHGVPVLGVEPTEGTARAAIARDIPTEIAFFGRETARRLAERDLRADLMVANNVLAHVPDIVDFIGGFRTLLKPGGIVTFEFPHLLNLIEKAQFDTIYHEHYSYLSLAAVERILGRYDLRVFDAETLPTHGGSLRLLVCGADAVHVETSAVGALRAAEADAGLCAVDSAAYRDFEGRVLKIREDFLSFLAAAKRDGKSVAGYGAAAKGNTFLNYCGAGREDLVAVADASHAKQGKLLPGSHILIVAPDELTRLKPDYVVILPWNLAEEIAGGMAHLRDWGGRFVVAVPELRVSP